MKVTLPLLASANAVTLFSPIYENVAHLLISRSSDMLTSLSQLNEPIDIAGNGALVSAITDFNAALNSMDNSDLVEIIENIDIMLLLNDEGSFNIDSLAMVFSNLDPIIVQSLQDEFITALPTDTLAIVNSSMNAFLDLGTVFQDLLNNEIELSNFVAVYNDFASAATQLDTAFGNQILGGATNAFLSYSSLITTLAEKMLVVQESKDAIQIAFRNANTLVELAIDDRLDRISHDGGSYWCTAARNGMLDTTQEFIEFIPDVIISNYYGPVSMVINLYNDFIHGVTIRNFNLGLYKINEKNLEVAISSLDSATGAISGTLTELNALSNPFQPRINNGFESLLC